MFSTHLLPLVWNPSCLVWNPSCLVWNPSSCLVWNPSFIFYHIVRTWRRPIPPPWPFVHLHNPKWAQNDRSKRAKRPKILRISIEMAAFYIIYISIYITFSTVSNENAASEFQNKWQIKVDTLSAAAAFAPSLCCRIHYFQRKTISFSTKPIIFSVKPSVSVKNPWCFVLKFIIFGTKSMMLSIEIHHF